MKKNEVDSDDLNYQYLPRLTIENTDELLRQTAELSAAFRRKLECEPDLAYGDSPGQRLDIYPGRHGIGPVMIFIHGGYWRSTDVTRSMYSHLAAPFIDAGATVVMPDYDLCPEVRVSDICAQIRNMAEWVYRNIHEYHGERTTSSTPCKSVPGTSLALNQKWPRNSFRPRHP